MRRHLVSILKLALIAALFWWVFANVQWTDQYTRTDASKHVVEQLSGSIRGDWDASEVTFVPEGGEPQQVVNGDLEDGGHGQVVPGLLTYFVHLDKVWFALGALGYLISLVVASQRWWWLLKVNGLDVRPMEVLRFTWIGVFFNNVVPGQTGGDVVKALYIVKRCPDGRVQALMSVIVDRILGLASLALLGAVVVLFQVERFRYLALGIWAVLALCCAIAIVAFSKRVRRAIHLDAILKKLPGRLSGVLMRIDQAVHFYRQFKGGVFAWLLIGVANHCVTVLSFVAMGKALGVGMPTGEYFVLLPVILIASAVPIAPNGWGVGEALFGTLFGQFGAVHLPPGTTNAVQVMATRGVALSVLYRLHTTLWSLIGGLMLLTGRERVTREEFQAEVAREADEERALATSDPS